MIVLDSPIDTLRLGRVVVDLRGDGTSWTARLRFVGPDDEQIGPTYFGHLRFESEVDALRAVADELERSRATVGSRP